VPIRCAFWRRGLARLAALDSGLLAGAPDAGSVPIRGRDRQLPCAHGGGRVSQSIGVVRPVPSEEELAAIMAAIQVTTPQVAVVASGPVERPWRFSGRWWRRPIAARRDRPR
jgi:hypothetical protein